MHVMHDSVFGAKFGGRAVLLLAEDAVKGGKTGKPGLHRDLGDRQVRLAQQLFCDPDLPVADVGGEGKAGILFEESGKMKFGKTR